MSRPYYCYQCANQVQVDMPAFTCHRCGGGFIQEMPEDPIPPPPDHSANLQQTRNGSLSGTSYGGAPRDSFADFGAAPRSNRNAMPGLQHPAAQPVLQVAGFSGGPGGGTQQQQQQQQQFPQHQHGQLRFTAQQIPQQGIPQIQQGIPQLIHGTIPVMRQVVTQVPVLQRVEQSGTPVIMSQPWMYQSGGTRAGNQPQFVAMQQPPPYATLPYAFQQQQPQHHQHPQQMQQPQQQQMPGNQMGGNAQQGFQQDGILIVGVQEEGGQQGQNMPANIVHVVGGNVNNLMQLLTENMDDVITAILNQMGSQGGPPPITQEDVDRIPTQPVTKAMLAEGKVCSICLENLNSNDSFKELTCTHQFHGPCIDRWLLIHGNCPICRMHFGTGSNAAAQADDNPFGAIGDPTLDGGQAMFFQHPHVHHQHFHIRPPAALQQQQQQWLQQQQQPGLALNHPSVYYQPYSMGAAPRQRTPNQVNQQQFFRAQQPIPIQHANPAGRVQFANVSQPLPAGISGQPGPMGEGIVWRGQVFLNNDPSGANPSIMLEMHAPPNPGPYRRPQTARYSGPPRQPRPQPQLVMRGAPPTNPVIRMSFSQPVVAAAGAVPGGSSEAAQPPQNVFQNLINSVVQAFGRTATPAGALSNPNMPAVPNPAGGEMGANAQAPTPPGSGSAAGGLPPSAEHPRKLQDDLDFD